MTTLFSSPGTLSRYLARPDFAGYFPATASNALTAFHPDPLFAHPRVPLFKGSGELEVRPYTADHFERLRDSVKTLAAEAKLEWPDFAAVPAQWRFEPFKEQTSRRWAVYPNEAMGSRFEFYRHQGTKRYSQAVMLRQDAETGAHFLRMGASAYVNGVFQELEIGAAGMKTAYDINLFGETHELAALFGHSVKVGDRAALVFAAANDLARLGYKNIKIRDYVMRKGILTPQWADLSLKGATGLARADGRKLHAKALKAPEISFENDLAVGTLKLGSYVEQGLESGALDELTWRVVSKDYSREILPLDRPLYFWLWQSAENYVKSGRG